MGSLAILERDLQSVLKSLHLWALPVTPLHHLAHKVALQSHAPRCRP